MINITINDKALAVPAGTAILHAAHQLGITIPTLCYMDGLPHNTSCMICVVQEIKSGKLVPSCSARVEDGMHIETDNARVREFRKDTLDLLLSEHVGDCQAPCQRICPAYMNIPLMIRQIQKQDWRAAIETVKADIALPAVLGRICPAPCESGCNRKQYDDAISICLLKRIVADIDLAAESPYRPPCAPASGKHVAIVGAGPAGLSAAYYLAQFGHRATIFDKNERPGGNLYYAISDKVLPKNILHQEIEQIRALGIDFEMNKRFDADFLLSDLQHDFDAVVLATGDIDSEIYQNTQLDAGARGLKIDRKSLATTIKGIFAGGSLVSSSRMAVRAVGHGKTLAMSVDQYLHGNPVAGRPARFNSRMGRLQPGEAQQFLNDSTVTERLEPITPHAGFSETEAVAEALRCFHCDCRKPQSCKLRLYADEYAADQNRYKIRNRNAFTRQVQHDLVIFEPAKCIKCGLCVAITAQAKETFGLTFIHRGFDVEISIPFQQALNLGLQKVAQHCAHACPTAAISLINTEETLK